jgi:hypothetical protein
LFFQTSQQACLGFALHEMKIAKFFRKQSKSLAEPAQLPDDGQATLDAGAKAALKKDGDNVKAEPNLVEPGAMDAAGSMDIDQVGPNQQGRQTSLFACISFAVSRCTDIIGYIKREVSV